MGLLFSERSTFYKGGVVAITGAGSGMGRDMAIYAAQLGARAVALSDVSLEGLDGTRAIIERGSKGCTVSCSVVDVSDRKRVFEWAEQVRDLHGGSLVALFNNAGIIAAKQFLDSSVEDIERVVDIDLYGVINCTKAFMPLLLETAPRRAAIVNTSSVCGFLGFPGNVAYSTAKYGVRGFSEALLNESQAAPALHHITVACIHPGAITTSLFANSSDHCEDTSISQAGVVLKKEDMQKMLTAAGGTSSTEAAHQILDQVADGYTRIMVGLDAKIFDWAVRAAPRFFYNKYAFNTLTVSATVAGKLFQLRKPLLASLILAYGIRSRYATPKPRL